MEQIYYTQCPVGYGLGASNGFQVKRLSRGYPMSGDFRHLGMKAYPGGGRTLAPPSLRYRRDGEVAEIAWLTPRANEYETERGLWGRPGGHFAHGLRLDAEELKAIKRWPAGLFDAPAWVRTDREPTRGRLPDEVELAPSKLHRPPTFADVAPLADREDPERLAGLLTAVAKVAREGRTLFVIDEPGRLGPLIALLTFAFPERLRDELTFSTYHDRPEELPGFRISGTIPLARPNKPALTAQGVVADLTLGTFEPRIEPAGWARTLAGWLTRHDAVDEADWSTTDGRARVSRMPDGTESPWPEGALGPLDRAIKQHHSPPPVSPWSDEWLGPLFAYPAALRSRAAPGDAAGWASLAGLAGWLHRSGLAGEWVRPRDPAWWHEAAGAAKGEPEARAALVAHAMLRDAWRGDANPPRWGEVVAIWFREAEPGERDRSIAAILQAAPKPARPSFARALLKGLTPAGADAVLDQLDRDMAGDRAMLLPIQAVAAVAASLAGGGSGRLEAIVDEARGWAGATSGVLDAIEAGIAERPEALSEFAAIASGAFDPEALGEGREGIAWALRRGPLAPAWLGPALRPVLADPGRQGAWLALRDRTPEGLRASLARAVLAIAADEGLPDEAFRWGVEALLLPLAPRPSDPSWAESYLRKTPSDLDLYDRLFDPNYLRLKVFDWLKEASGRRELSKTMLARVATCMDFYRARRSKDASSLQSIRLPRVPADQRGPLFELLLVDLAGSSVEGLPFVLAAAREAWPGAFAPGSPGLRDLATPLARHLRPLWSHQARWMSRLTRILEILGLEEGERPSFEPDGLAAEIVASATRLDVAAGECWSLRKSLLKDDFAWRILALDVRRSLEENDPLEASRIVSDWDGEVPMSQGGPGRKYELLLNACPGDRLGYAIAGLVANLSTYPRQPWWAHRGHAEAADDFREGFARIVPMAPLPLGENAPEDLVPRAPLAGGKSLSLVMGWVEGRSSRTAGADSDAPIAVTDEPESTGDGPGPVGSGPTHLSGPARARWACVRALTLFKNTDPSDRWRTVWDWNKDLPLASLPIDERHRFVAWLIMGLRGDESVDVARLARWLWKAGIRDYKRLGDWPRELEGLVTVPDELKIHRSIMNKDLRNELFRLLREEREPKAPKPAAHRRD